MLVFFFFKQKTAYEMRMSDWSSDVCSSDPFNALLGHHHIDVGSGRRHRNALEARDDLGLLAIGRGGGHRPDGAASLRSPRAAPEVDLPADRFAAPAPAHLRLDLTGTLDVPRGVHT